MIIPSQRTSIQRLIWICLAVTFFILVPFNLKAQNSLEFEGTTTTPKGKILEGASIVLYKNAEKDIEIRSGKNGVFKFLLPLGEDYKITFSYPGYHDMYLEVTTSNVPEEKLMAIFPLYVSPIYFYELKDTNINASQFKKPINKIIYDGKMAFKDEEDYFNSFVWSLMDPEIRLKERAERVRKEKEAKEKDEKERLEAEKDYQKTKLREALAAKAAKLKAETLAKAEALAREEAERKAREDLLRLKAEAEKKPVVNDNEESRMEMKAIQLQQNKEAKSITERKNKTIKSDIEDNLLQMVAQNERTKKSGEYIKMKSHAESNSVIEAIRNMTELKAKSDYMREREKGKDLRKIVNKQIKSRQVNKVIVATAFIDRSNKIYNQIILPIVQNFKMELSPNVETLVNDGFLQTTSLITVTLGDKINVYKKEAYYWGAKFYYKNNIELDEMSFVKEMAKYFYY